MVNINKYGPQKHFLESPIIFKYLTLNKLNFDLETQKFENY